MRYVWSIWQDGDHCFDDELTPEETDFFESEGIRYYSNVMATFTPSLRKAIEKSKSLEINTTQLAMAGLQKKSTKIIDDYSRFSLYAEGQARMRSLYCGAPCTE